MTSTKKPLSNKELFAKRPSTIPAARVKPFPIWLLVMIPLILLFAALVWPENSENYSSNEIYCDRFTDQTAIVPLDARLRSSELDLQIHSVHYNVPQDIVWSSECRKATLVEVTAQHRDDAEYSSSTSTSSIYLYDGKAKQYGWNSAIAFDVYLKKNNLKLLERTITTEPQRGWILFESDHETTNEDLTLIIPGDTIDDYPSSHDLSQPSN